MTMVGVVDNMPLLDMSWWDPDLGPLWSRSHLIQRGWTKRQIDALLGEPDARGRNPRGGEYVYLYSQRRVVEAEAAQ